MYVLTLFLFVVSSVYGASFEATTKSRWGAAVEAKLASGLIEGQSIKEPKETVLSVLDIVLLRQNNSFSKDCLFYLTPGNGNAGKLYIVELKSVSEKCRDHILDTALTKKEGIYNLGIELRPTLRLLIDEIKIEFNTNIDKKTLYSILQGEGKFKLKTGGICFDVDDQCNIIQSDFCDFCPGGVRRVITGSCPGIYRKYCGPSHCGGKEQAACIRGVKATGYQSDICINDSPVGFCKNGLRVICRENELICI